MLYLVAGKNEFLREEFVGQLKTLMRKLPTGEHNIDELGPTAPVADIVSACAVTPFLCEKRMVIARGVLSQASRHATASGRRPRTRASAAASPDGDPRATLAEYVPHLPETTHLVLVEDEFGPLQPILSARPDAVKRVFAPIREDALPAWIIDRARRYAVRIEQKAARDLAELMGTDLRLLDCEIAKLAAYVEPGATIGPEDVRQLVHGAGPGVFAFHDALAERRPAAALAAARSLLTRGTDPAELFAQISALIRRLLVVKEITASGGSLAREAPAFGLSSSPYALQKLQRQAPRWSASDLDRAYAFLRDGDIAIKRGRMDAELAVELAVAEIAGIPTRAEASSANGLPVPGGWRLLLSSEDPG